MLDWCFGSQLAFSKLTSERHAHLEQESSEAVTEAFSHVCTSWLICFRSSVWEACKPTQQQRTTEVACVRACCATVLTGCLMAPGGALIVHGLTMFNPSV